jgi:serine/threonine protein kinase
VTVSIAPGSRLGPYEVIAALGAGGLGEVWRARDTRLGREVAVKVLSETWREDRERLARFEREARAASRLSDPHVVAVFDVGREAGVAYLVTELVDGIDLRTELASGALPVGRAVELAAQVAEGLAAAHEVGIVHRDLKPANVLLTGAGMAKIADFGLARTVELPGSVRGEDSATVSSYSVPGVVMGTVGYMSPEQVRGEECDARTDIFALGSVLYEMLTGRRPFRRETSAETIAAILREDPPNPSQSNSSIPLALDRIVSHCLEKRAERRFQSARDLAFALRALAALVEGSVSSAPSVAAGTIRSVLPLPPGTRLSGQASPVLAISRDSTKVAYVALADEGPAHLYVSHLDRGETQLVAGSEWAEGPFFSPDGQWVGFAADVSAESPRPAELRKHSFSSGLTQKVCSLNGYEGAFWGENGDIYFVGSVLEGLRRVARAGMGRELPAVTKFRVGTTEGPRCIGYPRLVPGDRWAVLLDWDASALGDTCVLNLADGSLRAIATSGASGVVSQSGHLLYASTDGTLFGAPFHRSGGGLVGPPIAILKDLACDAAGGAFAVSDTGTLVYARGQLRGSQYESKRLVTLAVDGQMKPMSFPPDAFASAMALSPDGRHLAVTSRLNGLWICDLRRGTRARLPPGTTRLARYPAFSPDGEWVAFRGALVGEMGYKMFRQRTDGSGAAQILFSPDAVERRPRGFTADGESLLFETCGDESQRGLWSLPWKDPRESRRIVPGSIEEPCVSPDGSFVAYQSGEFGSVEVYVQPLAEPGRRVQVSVEGGRSPRWARDGRRIFYLSGSRFVSVSFDRGKARPDCGPPEPLFDRPGIEGYDVAPEGLGFLAVERLPDSGLVRQLELVTGWFDELRRLSPTGERSPA